MRSVLIQSAAEANSVRQSSLQLAFLGYVTGRVWAAQEEHFPLTKRMSKRATLSQVTIASM